MSQYFGTKARIALGLVVSAVCLWLAIGLAPMDELLAALTNANYIWLVPVFFGNVISLVVRGIRWRVLLGNRGSIAEYSWAQAIGCLLTNVFPLRAGEAGRVVIVSRRVGLPLVHVGASLVLERAADLTFVLGMLASLLLLMDVPGPIAATGLVLFAALVVALIGVTVLTVFGDRLRPLANAVASRLPVRFGSLALKVWDHGLAALEPIRDVRVLLQVAGWSAVIWIMGIGIFWAAIEAVVPGARLTEAAFALTAISVGISLPSSPGFIGVFQLVGQQALVTPFPDRFNPASALAVVVLFHAVYYVTTTALGAVGLARLGLSLRSVRVAEDAPPVVEATPSPTAQVS